MEYRYPRQTGTEQTVLHYLGGPTRVGGKHKLSRNIMRLPSALELAVHNSPWEVC